MTSFGDVNVGDKMCVCVVPEHVWDPSGKCDAAGPAARKQWGNGGFRILTPEAYTARHIDLGGKA